MKTSNPVHLPDTTLRLWLTAERIVEDDQRAKLDITDRTSLPQFLQDSDESDILRPLDKPWEIVVHDETFHLAPELGVKAWMTVAHPYDGKALTIMHHMPVFKTVTSQLTEGGTIVAENYLFDNETERYYDVQLHIHWPKQERKDFRIDEVIDALQREAGSWNEYSDEDYEVVAYLAHGNEPEKEYKAYMPSSFPAQFIADLREDSEEQKDLQQIAVQLFSVTHEYHDYSDDYKAAAGISDDEDSGWYTSQRKSTEKRLSFTIH